MLSIVELENLPEEIKKEVLLYAEYLLEKNRIAGRQRIEKKWADVTERGSSMGETASDTVVRLRKEERC